MGGSTDRCTCCDSTKWVNQLSARGWCDGCEKEFSRVITQLRARREVESKDPTLARTGSATFAVRANVQDTDRDERSLEARHALDAV